MAKTLKGLAWLRDVIQVLVMDRFDPKKVFFSQQASTACRSLRFHSRAKIPDVPLDQVIAMLASAPVEYVVLPGPCTKLGDVGSQTGYHVLGSLVQALQPNTILEFGTYLGVSTHTMALNAAKSCRIYTIDLPDKASSETVSELNALDRQHVQKSRGRVGEAFLGGATKEQIVQIRADSLTFRAETRMENVDFVYIDGGHNLPIITKDTENAFRILSPRGTIVWDDYFHLYPDVVQFLDDLTEQHPLYGIAGTNYVIYSRRFANFRIQ
jgi:predicted O-methyltransferase YrrM